MRPNHLIGLLDLTYRRLRERVKSGVRFSLDEATGRVLRADYTDCRGRVEIAFRYSNPGTAVLLRTYDSEGWYCEAPPTQHLPTPEELASMISTARSVCYRNRIEYETRLRREPWHDEVTDYRRYQCPACDAIHYRRELRIETIETAQPPLHSAVCPTCGALHATHGEWRCIDEEAAR